MVDFKVSAEDMRLIKKITNRAIKLERSFGMKSDVLTWHMDFCACHNSNPLDLAGLLAAQDGDFSHDVFGIRKYMNRKTGQLGDCFSPRYSQMGGTGK